MIVVLQTIDFHLLHNSELPSLSIGAVCELRVSVENQDVTEEFAGSGKTEEEHSGNVKVKQS